MCSRKWCLTIIVVFGRFISIAVLLYSSLGTATVEVGTCVNSDSDNSGGSCDASVYEKADQQKDTASSSFSSSTYVKEVDSATKVVQSCEDQNENCQRWAERHECDKNPSFMHKFCAKSCQTCLNADEELLHGLDMGVSQLLKWRGMEQEIVHRIEESRKYIKDLRQYNSSNDEKNGKNQRYVELDPEVLDVCMNQHEKCTAWALLGECDKNKVYMHINCAPACFTCDQLDIRIRCPLPDPNTTIPAWQPGDLDLMFQRLTAEPYLTDHDVKVLSKDPWIITMENVVSSEEAHRLIELGFEQGYTRSKVVGVSQPGGKVPSVESDVRTSSTTRCQGNCMKDAVAIRVMDRLSNISGINVTNSEHLQLLEYETGQYYNVHHDYLKHNRERQQGVRMLTIYLYLNDVEAGGGTRFDQLNLTVMPKQGRALLWPSVLNGQPHEKDGRTTHSALPVEAGVKYGANAWFHQYDFLTPDKNDCTL